MPDDDKRIDLNEEEAQAFMTKLAHDDDFRAALEKDPAKALEGEGISVPEEELPKEVKLPSKEEVQGRFKDYVERAQRVQFPHIPIWGRACVDPDPPGSKPGPKPGH